MSRNGAAVMNVPAGIPVSTGGVIQSTQYNSAMQDICNELTNSIPRDGQGAPTANLPMGGFKHTGCANGVAATDYATLGQLSSISGSFGNSYVFSSNQVLTSYYFGSFIEFTAAATCQFPTPIGNGGKIISIWNNSSGIVTLTTVAGSFLGPNSSAFLISGALFSYVSDGSNWICTVSSAITSTGASASRNASDHYADSIYLNDDWTSSDTFTSALIKAVARANGRSIRFPSGTFNLTQQITSNSIWIGEGRVTTTINKAFNGDMVIANSKWGLRDISLQGQGATYTGRGVVINAAQGMQHCINFDIADFDGYSIDFVDTTSGSQSWWMNGKIWRTNGGTAGREAVHIQDAAQIGAMPRHFHGIESEGTRFIQLGGCNDLFVTNSWIGNVVYSANSVGAQFAACRYGGNSTAVTMSGFNHSIVGCDISPVITLALGTGECAIVGNSYNNAVPIIDNSGNGGRNQLTLANVQFTPTWQSTGTAPTLGNGTLTGVYSCHGAAVTVTYDLTFGSTTTVGSGDFQFLLPFAPALVAVPTVSQHHGVVVVTQNSSAHRFVGACIASQNSNILTLVVLKPSASDWAQPINGLVSFPITFAAGDSIRASITYNR